jgi:hypothetical protein
MTTGAPAFPGEAIGRWAPTLIQSKATARFPCSVYIADAIIEFTSGVEMTNESIKVLLMVILLGGLRTAISGAEPPKSESWLGHKARLDWLRALVWPAMPQHAPQRIVARRNSRRTAV